jgi:hypothetical protein
MKPLPPGDSASCPDEDAYQPEALKVQVGGNHYKNFAIQPVEFIEKNNLSFLEGCVIKRVCRHDAKAGAEDLRKAIHELQLLIELRYGEKA